MKIGVVDLSGRSAMFKTFKLPVAANTNFQASFVLEFLLCLIDLYSDSSVFKARFKKGLSLLPWPLAIATICLLCLLHCCTVA